MGPRHNIAAVGLINTAFLTLVREPGSRVSYLSRYRLGTITVTRHQQLLSDQAKHMASYNSEDIIKRHISLRGVRERADVSR